MLIRSWSVRAIRWFFFSAACFSFQRPFSGSTSANHASSSAAPGCVHRVSARPPLGLKAQFARNPGA